MSSDKITLKMTERTEMGKAVKALRRDGIVPAVIYERGHDSVNVSVPFGEITKTYHQAGKHHPVELSVGTKNYLSMIKDVDIDPVKGTIRHIAFHAINKNETVTAEIPVHIEGEIPAERLSLLVLRPMDTVEVEALPANLPDALIIDGAKLAEIGDKLAVSDIVAPDGVKILTDPEQTLAVVEEPKDQIAEADAALAETEEQGDNAAAEVDAEKGSVDADEPGADSAEKE
jgi:large subunit ribosomal protein L25